MTVRGVTNNNPMNIKDFGIKWDGLVGKDDHGLCIFKDPVMGIRAGTIDILGDFIKDGKHTIGQLISEFAPETENPLSAYTNYLCGALGVKSDQAIDLKDITTLYNYVCAIIAFETGHYKYDDTVILEGIRKGMLKFNL